jgi:hypothetical protein
MRLNREWPRLQLVVLVLLLVLVLGLELAHGKRNGVTTVVE